MTVIANAGIDAARRAPRLQTAPIAPLLLVAPLVLYLLAFYALPVAAMLSRSVTDPHWTLANYARLPADPVFLRVLASTLTAAGIVTAGTIVLGYPVALAMGRLRPALANIVVAIVLLPFWTSVLVRSYAWMVLLGRHGLVNEALTAAGIIATPLRLLNTPLAIYIAMIHILLPYAILPLASVLRQIDGALLRAAAGLGANPWRVFRQIVLPLSLPGVAAGMLLVFVLSLGFYITPALVGGPRDTMLSMLIAQQVDLLNWPYAAALSTTLLAVALVLIGMTLRLPALRQALRGAAR
jgi:ABC-type spermidine/putrescine transport system permease subunit I